MRAYLLLLVAACYQPTASPGAPCGPLGECPSNLECIAGDCVVPTDEVDAAVGVDACTTGSCDGNMLVGCGEPVTCEFGCVSPAEGSRCARLVPSNGLTPGLLDGATQNLASDKLQFDTDDGSIKRQSVEIRPEGEGVINGIGFTVIDGMGVFTANSFAVPANESWDPSGVNTFVLYAATTIDIAGTIDGGASLQSAKLGGGSGGTSGSNPGCRGRAGKAFASGAGEGGGGGGGATDGGNGAPSSQATFGAGGPACSAPSTIPLRGGNGGGAGGIDNANGSLRGGAGGGGGGAIALVAMQSIRISGVVTVPGAGGIALSGGDGGGGGGGGGAVFLEAPTVTVEGALTANGGGGAGGSSGDGSRGHTGDGVAAAGGTYNGTAGGRGGTGTQAPTAGQNYTNNAAIPPISRGGGGGGAVGRTEVKSRTPSLGGALSPMPVTTTATIE